MDGGQSVSQSAMSSQPSSGMELTGTAKEEKRRCQSHRNNEKTLIILIAEL